MLEKKERMVINPDTGKAEWVTIKKGLFNKKASNTPVYDKLKPQIKTRQKAISKKKWEQRKKNFNKTAKTVNNALDWLEGKNTTKARKNTPKTPKTQYIIRNNKAYPIARQKKTSNTKKKKKKQPDPFDFKIHW